MRFLFFILVVLATTCFGQTPVVNQSFAEATRRAQNLQFESAIEKYQLTLLQAENEKLNDAFIAQIHFNIGVCFYQLKQTNEAVAEYNEAIKLSRREYQKAFYALGMAQAKLKNFDEAETAFRDALKLDKTNGEAWFDLAFVHLAKADFDAAEKAFANSIKYKTVASAAAFNNLGVIFALRHDFQNAETQFEKAIFQSNGESVEAEKNLRFCRQAKKRFDQNLLAKFEFSRQNNSGE